LFDLTIKTCSGQVFPRQYGNANLLRHGLMEPQRLAYNR
jgi:hypothetical protein